MNAQRPRYTEVSNPFASRYVRPSAVPYFFEDGQSCEHILHQLACAGWRGQIIGPHGSGKTCLLETLCAACTTAGWRIVRFTLGGVSRRLPDLTRHSAAWDEATLVVVDGYEQLTWPGRIRLRRLCRRRSCGLLVTAHQNVGLSTIHRTKPNERSAAQVVRYLLRGTGRSVDKAELARVFASCDGNLRESLFGLYDWFEACRERPHTQRSTSLISAIQR